MNTIDRAGFFLREEGVWRTKRPMTKGKITRRCKFSVFKIKEKIKNILPF